MILIISNKTQTFYVKAAHNFGSVVRGSIVHNDQFQSKGGLARKGIDLPKGFGNTDGLIERWNDNGNYRLASLLRRNKACAHRGFRCFHKTRYCIIRFLYE